MMLMLKCSTATPERGKHGATRPYRPRRLTRWAASSFHALARIVPVDGAGRGTARQLRRAAHHLEAMTPTLAVMLKANIAITV